MLIRFAALVVGVLVVGCGSAGPASPRSEAGSPGRARVLSVSINQEPKFIGSNAPIQGGAATDFWQRLFSAYLDLYDDQGRPLPYLAEALPVLNTDSWTVLPDGRMETRYHLKPNLTWHDGVPLTTDDFIFGFQVATPDIGFRTTIEPYTKMANVSAPDDRTLVIQWKSLYPGAGVLLQGATRYGLVPFPRHILEPTIQDQGKAALTDSPYWTHEFVGAGPFKLDHWELGSHLEASAFDQHVLGRPKIDRIRMAFISDPNTALANLLAGATDVSLDSISFANVLDLKREWGGTDRGTAGYSVVSLHYIQFQFRPEYANPRAALDLRVRRALAHGIDKQTVSEVWGGELAMLDSIFDPSTDYYLAIDRALIKYAYDPRTSERLMSEAGYSKGPDGFFASPAEGKPSFALQAGGKYPELPVIAATWRQIGLDNEEQRQTSGIQLPREASSTFPGLAFTTTGVYENQQLALYLGSEVTSAENRWQGQNSNGWVNPAYDRLVETFSTTLDPNQRIQERAQIAKILSEELPAIILSHNPNTHAFLSTVRGITNKVSFFATGRITWNIEQWEIA
ncbi:MAG TPA: ABC transporter substrate-binding protein [Chloroflexota bacterium]